MEFPRRRFLHLAASAAVLPAISHIARAQTYPTRPITIVDTFPPGGSTGIIARILSDKLSEPLGQQIIVDSRGGAGGTVAARQIAKGAPDGYTIMLAFTGTLAIAPSLYSNAGYDPRKELCTHWLNRRCARIARSASLVSRAFDCRIDRLRRCAGGNIESELSRHTN